MTNVTCSPGNTLSAQSLIQGETPQNATFAIIPGTNKSDARMTACCAPNKVHLALDCLEWCELPPRFLNSLASQGQIQSNFTGCLVANGANASRVDIVGLHFATAAGRSTPTLVGLGVWMLVFALGALQLV